MFCRIILFAALQAVPACPGGVELADIPAGSFLMGSTRGGEDSDEGPVHRVNVSAFRMGVTPVTNAQYEAFRPEHKDLRGQYGFSSGDDEAVVCVSWYDAVAYCEWLSSVTGRHFRLPTEAEWEYACRAGTSTDFWTGDGLPTDMQRHQRTERDKVPVSLQVACSEPNPFGLHDMHGLVEEWCLDWYGPYAASEQTDPSGAPSGDFRVTRGGSHNTPLRYLRSANRSAMIPSDNHVQTGFRVVESSLSFEAPEAPSVTVCRDRAYKWRKARRAVFETPVPFVVPPEDSTVHFYSHNHQPAVTWCRDGSLLAIWFSCDAESGREMTVLSSRFAPGGACTWTPAVEFFKVPDRNMTGSALCTDPSDGRLHHFNGVADSGDWQNLALCMRVSGDDGRTWSAPRLIEPEHRVRHQVIAGTLRTREGWLIQACDAGPGGEDGTSLHVSRDGGESWEDTGSTIAGIHAGVVQLSDGSLMAYGRGNSIPGPDGLPRMPCSISRDGGVSWEYHPTEFPPIGSGQRLVLRRLDEGPLLLVSFGEEGLFAALSYDDGVSWPVKKLLTDGSGRTFDGGAWTGTFVMDCSHAEPKGYLACTQTPDGMIHLLSSRLHYRFNLKWLLQTVKNRQKD